MANWIKKNDDHFDWLECSECGYGSEGEVEKATPFCPICGARMDGGMSNIPAQRPRSEGFDYGL